MMPCKSSYSCLNTMPGGWSSSSGLYNWILIGIVAWVYGLIAFICLFIQWFHILILGRRNQGLSDFAKGYLEYLVHVFGYTYIMTDTRPDILPVPVRIYEEELPKK
jgi:hypothetical protein